MKRVLVRKVLLLSAVACVLILVALATIPAKNGGATYSDFARLQEGMTVHQVESSLGMPGAVYPVAGVNTLAWHAEDGGLITVRFDDAGHAEVIYRFPPQESLWHQLYRLLRVPFFTSGQSSPPFPSGA